MNIGENIHKYRALSSMSQGDLASALEVSRQSVSKWENNFAQPELDKLCKMSALFGVTLDELVYGGALPRNRIEKAPEPLKKPLPPRVFIGSALLILGSVLFLAQVFLSAPMSAGEMTGILLAANLIMISLSLLATYSTSMLLGSMIAYAVYNMIGFGFFKEISLPGALFSTAAGAVLLVWFIVWGMHYSKKEQPASFRSV
ncbi:MAG: helix-turn-helix transcriptional regulator [Clostridia bacterium]|nr:helix-turn-helix transcriptional regulator [Clostridia bacterium]